MKRRSILAATAAIIAAGEAMQSMPYADPLSIRSDWCKPSAPGRGKNRDKVKAARKQNRKRKSK